MGGGKDQKQANAQLASQQKYQAESQKQFDTRNTADLESSRAKGDQLYNSMYGGYSSLAQGQGAPGSAAAGGGGGGGGVPGADNSKFGDVESSYRNFMSTGGWDPSRVASMDQNIQGLKALGTGGMSPEDMARARGGGGYEEFAKTGGLSDKDRQNIRTRANSGIPAAYANIKAAGDRQRAVAGGYGPGAQVMQGRMARQQVGGMADAALNAELGITDKVNQGRQWGIGGMSSSELALQDQLARNKYQGLTGASNVEQGMQESIMGGKQWGTGGLEGMADKERAAAAQGAAMGQQNSQWQQQFDLQRQLAGLEGMGSLYTSTPEEYMANKSFALNSAQGYGGNIGGLATAQKTGNKSAWDTVGQLAGAVAGGATGLGGLGGMAKAAGGLGTAGQLRPGQF